MIKLNDVIHSPTISKNLLSINKLCQDNNYCVVFDDSSICIKDRRTDKVVTTGRSRNGLYELNLNERSPVFEVNAIGRMSMDLWHARFWYMSEEAMRNMIKMFQLPVCNNAFKHCTSCVMGKMHRLHSPLRLENSASDLLEVIYADIWGPAPVPSLDGHRYYINFVDGFSKFNWLFPIFQKSNALSVFKKFKLLVEKQTRKPIKSLQTDNGGEFIAFTEFLEQSGISHR